MNTDQQAKLDALAAAAKHAFELMMQAEITFNEACKTYNAARDAYDDAVDVVNKSEEELLSEESVALIREEWAAAYVQ